ncbi:MAG: HAMP domain-containing histidine kinase [Clostridia bacterium]|nr:HAMP domain-containing histidine kinase [Clostridia bacterium]
MFKGKSLPYRINLWYTAFIFILSVGLIIMISIAGHMAQRTEAQQNLIRSVERNMDEIEVDDGVLDIESDFAFKNGNVNTVVFSEAGEILAGEYPEGISTDEPLQNGEFRTVDIDGKDYYIYDSIIEYSKYEYKINGVTGDVFSNESEGIDGYTPYEGDLNIKGDGCELTYAEALSIALKDKGLSEDSVVLITAKVYEYYDNPLYELEFYSAEKAYEDVWVRGIVRADSADGIWRTITIIAFMLLPLYVAVASFLGYRIAKKSMKPIKELRETANEIQSGQDLSKRIEIDDSDPDIKNLSDSFNNMIGRLDSSFSAQRHFTSDASHELRTPVAVILAECEYQLSEDLDEDVRESIESINKQALSMKNLITQLLSFAKIEQGSHRFEMSEENLSEIVRSVAEDIAKIGTKNIEIICQVQDDITMTMEVSLMARLAENLISNAVRYGKENGFVKVALARQGTDIVFSVEDNGIGIDEADIGKIWQRFYRVDKAHSREEGCSGLGLAMVKQIAELHGGRVSVESEVGKGSTFTVIFPDGNGQNRI